MPWVSPPPTYRTDERERLNPSFHYSFFVEFEEKPTQLEPFPVVINISRYTQFSVNHLLLYY